MSYDRKLSTENYPKHRLIDELCDYQTPEMRDIEIELQEKTEQVSKLLERLESKELELLKLQRKYMAVMDSDRMMLLCNQLYSFSEELFALKNNGLKYSPSPSLKRLMGEEESDDTSSCRMDQTSDRGQWLESLRLPLASCGSVQNLPTRRLSRESCGQHVTHDAKTPYRQFGSQETITEPWKYARIPIIIKKNIDEDLYADTEDDEDLPIKTEPTAYKPTLSVVKTVDQKIDRSRECSSIAIQTDQQMAVPPVLQISMTASEKVPSKHKCNFKKSVQITVDCLISHLKQFQLRHPQKSSSEPFQQAKQSISVFVEQLNQRYKRSQDTQVIEQQSLSKLKQLFTSIKHLCTT